MRVVVAHNFYRSATPSGENVVVEAEVELLRSNGVAVEELFAYSDDIPQLPWPQKVGAALGPVYNPFGHSVARHLFEDFRPDVVHVHNVFPLISPTVLPLAHGMGIATVHTVHNFRPDCANGMLFRDGTICEECTGHKWAYPAVRHRCYRGSTGQTTAMALGRRAHRETWNTIDHYIVLTDFHRARLLARGIPSERVTVRPTPVPDPEPTPQPGSGFLFLGRLDEAKGVRLLLSAWEALDPSMTLRIAGAGPLASEAARAAARLPHIDYVGAADAGQAGRLIDRSAAVVVPSLWYEGYPRVIAEAFSRARPAIVSDHGGLRSIVTPEVGWRFAPDPASLAATVRSIQRDELVARGRGARARFEHDLSSEQAFGSLQTVYAKALLRRGKEQKGWTGG